MEENKVILVTGASGMIGSYLVYELLNRGHKVIGIDIKERKVENPNYTFFSIDLGNVKALDEAFNKLKVDRVIHLAALAHPLGKSDHDLQRIRHLNVECAENVFKVSALKKVPVLFISTVDTFGMVRGLLNPNSETKPVTNYGITKLEAENILKKVSSAFDIFRLSPVYTADIKRDIQKRYYLSYPKCAYRIGPGEKFEVLDIKKAINEMANWVNQPTTNSIRIIKDDNLLDVNELIAQEKAEGRAKHVLHFPKGLVKLGYYCLYPILRESNISYLIFKALWPFRTTNEVKHAD